MARASRNLFGAPLNVNASAAKTLPDLAGRVAQLQDKTERRIVRVESALPDKQTRGESVIINPSDLDTSGLGDRGPLFIWNNPDPADIPAGYNAGIQIYIGANPGGTPGAGDAIGQTIVVTNEANRTNMWGLDIVVLQVGAPLTGNDGVIRGIEVEISTVVSEQLDPFQNSGGNPRKDGIEFVHNAHGGTKRGTAAAWIWSADAATAGMWSRGMAISRVADVGIDIGTWQGDTASNSFQTAAIYDHSGSAVVLKVAGTHGSILDMASASAPTDLIKGLSGAASNFGVRNYVDFDATWSVDSGTSAAQQAFLQLKDRGTAKWSLIKNSNNQLSVFNHATSKSTIFITAGDFIAFGGSITPSQIIDINDDSIRVRTAKTPATAAAAGNAGQIAWDSGFLYVCVASNTWKRIAIATW